MGTQPQAPAKITRKTFLVGTGSLVAGPLLASRALGATEAPAGDRHRDGPPVSAYPILTGGPGSEAPTSRMPRVASRRGRNMRPWCSTALSI
jgi:hypothetical protein